LLFCFVFYYLQTFDHLEGVAHYAAVFAPALKVNGLVVIVDKNLGEDPLVVVEPLGPLRDSPFFHFVWLLSLLAQLHGLLFSNDHMLHKEAPHIPSQV
jgi:hypothetical protein